MNLELRYDKKNKRLYASRSTVVLFVTLIFLITLISITSFLVLRRGSLGLKTPESEVAPLTLGTAPKSSPEASQSAIDRMKKEVAGKLVIVFFYDGYRDQNEALGYIEVMKAALDLVEPYKSLKDIISFKTLTTDGDKCHVEKKVKNLLVCDKKIIESFNKLGLDHFKLVIVSPLDFVPAATIARGKNSAIYFPTYQGALTKAELNQFIGRFFIHELGHAFGLRDEYIRNRPQEAIVDPEAYNAFSSNKAYQPAQPNCAPDEETAKNWWGSYVGVIAGVDIFPGCAGRDTYFFPQKGTIMSDLPEMEGYGQVSEDYLRGVLSCFYGNKETLIFQVGFEATYSAKLKNCETFKKEYPKFWAE